MTSRGQSLSLPRRQPRLRPKDVAYSSTQGHIRQDASSGFGCGGSFRSEGSSQDQYYTTLSIGLDLDVLDALAVRPSSTSMGTENQLPYHTSPVVLCHGHKLLKQTEVAHTKGWPLR